eukprot:m.575700 g.575700  ORF g.575700 m.575700 type:complete len:598 (+) comp22285_c0_seq9:469-2262(+)
MENSCDCSCRSTTIALSCVLCVIAVVSIILAYQLHRARQHIRSQTATARLQDALRQLKLRQLKMTGRSSGSRSRQLSQRDSLNSQTVRNANDALQVRIGSVSTQVCNDSEVAHGTPTSGSGRISHYRHSQSSAVSRGPRSRRVSQSSPPLRRRRLTFMGSSGASRADACGGIDVNDLRFDGDRVLGEGSFGDVRLAHYKTDVDDMMVAVKTIRDNALITDKTRLIEEGATMAMLQNNPNVVHFVGVVADNKASVCMLVMLYYEQGSLDLLLQRQRLTPTTSIHIRNVAQIAFDVAKGMEFCTARSIIHRDLATRNVLVSSDNQYCVSDFGLAVHVPVGQRAYTEKSGDPRSPLPLRWTAIEVLRCNGPRQFSEATDIWAYGILMYELFTQAKLPYTNLQDAGVISFLRQGKRLGRPWPQRHEGSEVYPSELFALMRACWSEIPSGRPLFDEVTKMLLDIFGAELLLGARTHVGLQRQSNATHLVLPPAHASMQVSCGAVTGDGRGHGPLACVGALGQGQPFRTCASACLAAVSSPLVCPSAHAALAIAAARLGRPAARGAATHAQRLAADPGGPGRRHDPQDAKPPQPILPLPGFFV